MRHETLQESLERLRAEINSEDLSDDSARRRLNALVSDIERKLERPEDAEHHESLVQNLTDSIGQLETEYPRATTILNQIMVALGNIGI